MTRTAFEALRNLPGKKIHSDITFSAGEGTDPVRVFDNIVVENSLGWDLLLNGKYNGLLPSVVYNFRVRGVGPICRVEVNGTMHKGSRTHKHTLRNEEDPRLNLPHADHRPDLVTKSPREVWYILCKQANIEHTGRFIDP